MQPRVLAMLQKKELVLPLANPAWQWTYITQTSALCGKIQMGLGGLRDAESASPVRSNIACPCDLQTAFMWPLRARWTVVIDLDLIDSFSMVENTPQPEWTQHARSFWCPEIVLEPMECRRFAINSTIRITCGCIWHQLVSDLLWILYAGGELSGNEEFTVGGI